ncbi:MAG: flagellar FliJ family protein [Alphaproteobacteria bacterium]|nr:flagellar FliJ family protein [Alphaproteobacteria bacterium]
MADLSSLIRVRKHSVEQKQKRVAELYREAEELAAQKAKLLGDLEAEEERVKDMSVEMMSYFGPYSEAVKDRVASIEEKEALLETRIEVARDDMRRAFAELKKIEITQERREDEEEKAINKKESAELDEIAIEGFRRKQDEG